MTDALRRLADEAEIRNLLARIAQLADEGSLDDYLACFTEDATWGGAGFPERKGHAAILAGAVFAALNMKGERVGLRLLGLLHPAADGLKTAFKEDIVPLGVDRLMYGLAPWLAFFPSLVVMACLPFGDTLCFGTTPEGGIDITALQMSVPADGVCTAGALKLQVADLNVGILYFFAVAGTGIVGAALAGWASDNKYSLLGGLRAASQMVSYEVTLGLTLVGAMMLYGSLQVDDMVRWQRDNTWGIFAQPLAFLLFFTAAVAESKRIPFDIPEGESELVAGYFTEYCGMKFAMFMFSEYIAMVAAGAVMAAIFLGEKIGPRSISNRRSSTSKIRVPTMSAGIRSGVNWMRWNLALMAFDRVMTASVFARPGIPSSRTWPQPARSTLPFLNA